MHTLYCIISLFGLGALVGMYLLTLVLQKKDTPKFVVFIHGIFVIAALILLIDYTRKEHANLTETIIIFILTALGGLTLLVRDLTKKSLPHWLAIGHAIIAITGFVYLIVYAYNN